MVAPLKLKSEGDRTLKLHAEWMVKTHQRDGEEALLQYTVSKRHNDDGNVIFSLTEIYETAAGLVDHHEQGATWEAIEDWIKWIESCQVTAVEGTNFFHSLW